MSKLTFHKSSSAPTTDAGAIWFDSTNKQIKIKDISGWETYSVSSIPSSLPASDVYEWAKAKTKPTYTYSEVGAAAAAHHHTIADVDGLQTALDAKISSSEKGSNNGVAQLDENGRVPSSQLPSYVDDVIEASGVAAFPQTGEAGKIYVDTKTNLTYRWSGTTYVEISPSLALGETSSTAYAGDKGAATTSKVNTHVANTDIHITADERTKWNSAATNSHKLYKANECEDYTSDDGGLTPAAVKKLADKKLSLSGGTMSGNIALPNNAGIIQTQDSTSNSTTAITWLTGGVGTFYTDADGTSKKYKYQPHISQHNMGGASGTGSITLAPYPTNLAPWEKKVGLYISEDEIKYKGKDLVTSDQVPTNTVVSGQYSAMMTDDRKLFLAEDCDALYSANKRFTVTLTNNGNKIDNNCNELFDGSIESVVALSAGTNVILIDCGDNFEWTYGEGWLLTNFYHTFVPTSVSARIYSNTSGWSNVTMEHKGGGGAQWYEGATPVIIRISKIEVTIEVAENSTCQLNSLLYILRRPDHHSSSVRKYQPETLYHNLTVPSLTVNGTNFSGYASELKDFTTKVYDATYPRTANTFLAAPNGSNGVGTFRKIEESDLPNITSLGYAYNYFSKLVKDYDFSSSQLTTSAILEQILKNLCKDYPKYSGAVFSGKFTTSYSGFYTVCIEYTNQIQNELPVNSYGYVNILGGNSYIFGTINYSFYFQELVTTQYVSNHLTWAEWS